MVRYSHTRKEKGMVASTTPETKRQKLLYLKKRINDLKKEIAATNPEKKSLLSSLTEILRNKELRYDKIIKE